MDGWLRWMKSVFEQGEIMQIWKSTIEMENGLILPSSNLSIRN